MNTERAILNEEAPEFKAIWDEWKKRAGNVKTPEELRDFADHLMNDYIHDYGTCVRAIACLALAGAYYGAENQGITGFQAGYVMWDFIRGWMFKDNECGLWLLDYDDLLYPQYANRFNTISEETWELVQEKAKEYLEIRHGANDEVRKHWESIVAGEIPAGLKIDKE